MATKKVQGAADGSTPDTTIVDETAAKVEFGSDAWGTWAQGVQDRLSALEAGKSVSANTSVSAGGSDGRLARIEQMMGIRAEADVSENDEATDGQEVSDEAKATTDG